MPTKHTCPTCGAECECDAADAELDALLRESAEISSEPIRSGIGLKDFVQMVRTGVASKQAKEK